MKKLRVFDRINEKRNFKMYPAMCAFALAVAMPLSACSTESPQILQNDNLPLNVTFDVPDDDLTVMFNRSIWDYEGEIKNVKIEKQTAEIEIPYEEFQTLLNSDDETITISDDFNTFQVNSEVLNEVSLKAEESFGMNHSNIKLLITEYIILPSIGPLCVLAVGGTMITYQKIKTKIHQKRKR